MCATDNQTLQTANPATGNGMKRRHSWMLKLFALSALTASAWAQQTVPSTVALQPEAAPAPRVDVRVDGAATPITLKQAVAIALEKNPLRKAALAEQQAAAADVREARSALLPHLTFSESATRGNDPVYVFGTRLRQSRFTAEDFALNRLNSPLPLGNFTTRLAGQWSLFQAPDWLNVRRAEIMKNATTSQRERTDQETVFRAVNAYYGLLLAFKQQQLAEQQFRTAQSILQFSQARYESGLVVQADYLAAQVNAAGRQQELIRARNAVSLARVQLNVVLGLSADLAYEPGEALAERGLELPALREAEKRAMAQRPDLKQIELQQDAQQAGVRMAQSAFLPRVNAFAGWQMDNPTLLAGGGSNNWVAGLEVQVDLFTGGAKTARLSHERAMQERLAALHQAAIDSMRLEVRKAWYDADSTRQQLEVARSAITQAEESLRINQTRYQAGLQTITDLLRAEESTRRTQTDYWQAVCAFQTAFANLELAMGALSENSRVIQ
jgi:outer membrane protein TolC